LTTLHYLLLGLALLLVVGVMIYNAMQERRLRKQIDGMFSRSLDDPLSDSGAPPAASQETETVAPTAERLDELPGPDESQDTYDEMITLMRRAALEADDVEVASLPQLDSGGGGDHLAPEHVTVPAPAASPWAGAEAPSPGAPSTINAQPVAAPVAAPAAPVEAIPAAYSTPSPLDGDIECVARLRPGQREQQNYGGLIERLRRLGKPVRAYALDQSGHWSPLVAQPAHDYAAIELGVQMVDRKGALTEAQLDAFCNSLYEFAAEHGGAVSCPDAAPILEKAKSLDAFCMEVDMLIGLNLVAHEGMPFTVKRIDDLARSVGMSLDRLGSYVLADNRGHALFTLVNQNNTAFKPDNASQTTPAVTLLFDVPNVDNGLAVFDRMTELGFRLARSLGGRMVDDQGHAVTEASLQKDRQQLATFYSRMQARGIPAGGERAHRLFA
jgi:hypothetical protein